ncbi:5-formyltetrahydrofolate cyclo-ligase [Paenibacillus terrigena]|uniref:5-formyltetrahydrofolate cyclo-ligase n=1 Tax=Paenibacillus terrigena TaxID=369333 RepID=UPI0028D0F73A|nr:5-formyltetrahydrofolate cyclo-ligase [Paenibacillus terrigena]
MSEKQEIRKRIRTLRKALSASEHRVKSEQICREAARWVDHKALSGEQSANRSVFVYLPYEHEIDVIPFIQHCWDRGYAVYAPHVDQAAGQMQLFQIRSLSDVEVGSYGIREPKLSLPLLPATRWAMLDWVVVPGLAFDQHGGRMGYGGGYYDRFMARVAASHPEESDRRPLCIALAFSLQVIDRVPMEVHDLRVDCLITEDMTLVIDSASYSG